MTGTKHSQLSLQESFDSYSLFNDAIVFFIHFKHPHASKRAVCQSAQQTLTLLQRLLCSLTQRLLAMLEASYTCRDSPRAKAHQRQTQMQRSPTPPDGVNIGHFPNLHFWRRIKRPDRMFITAPRSAVTLTHTSSVGHWADNGSDFAEPRLSSCSGQTPEVASLPLCWRLHLNTDTGEQM